MSVESYILDTNERETLLGASTRLQNQNLTSLEQIVQHGSELAPHLRTGLPRLLSFIQTHVKYGFGTLPVHNLPTVSNPDILSVLLGFLLGKVVRYENEGDFVIAVKVQSQKASKRASFSNSKCFYVHTDLSYAPEPPPYILLHCLHNDTREGGYTTLCSLEEIVKHLPAAVLNELQKSQFLFPPPSHYIGTFPLPQPILKQLADGSFCIRFRRDGIRTIDRSGIEAVAELIHTIGHLTKEIHVEDNTVLLMNNQKCLHGRTAFLPSASSEAPRHLNRVYAV